MRPTSYALHIRPLFTQVDIDHMAEFGVDLATHLGVRANAAAILTQLQDPRRPMPPVADSGPWPEEWIALFDRWIKEGCLA
jgi:hypothetical protein